MTELSELFDYDAELRRHNELLRAATRVGPGDRVLDIGCGTGQTTREAARVTASGSAVGVDLSVPMLEQAVSSGRPGTVQRRLPARRRPGPSVPAGVLRPVHQSISTPSARAAVPTRSTSAPDPTGPCGRHVRQQAMPATILLIAARSDGSRNSTLQSASLTAHACTHRTTRSRSSSAASAKAAN